MILTCPECSTRYKAKKETIGPNGRTVSCNHCSATWFAAAEDELTTPDDLQLADMKAEASALNEKEITAPLTEDIASQNVASLAAPLKSSGKSADAIMRDKVDAAKRKARLRTIGLIWLIPLTFIALIALGLIIARETIVDRYPGTAPLYTAVGLKTSVTGLEIESPIIRIARVNGSQTVIINGAVRNISRDTQSLPFLILSLHTETGDELARWRVEFNQAELKSGERIEFASEYPNPPLDLKRLRYRLGDEGERFEAPVGASPETPNSDLEPL